MAVDIYQNKEQFKNGVRINPFILDGNKWYNRTVDGGYATTKTYGSPQRSGANTLCNCVGLANGAFNETFVKCKRLVEPSFEAKEYYAINGNGNTAISRAKSLGLTTVPPEGIPPIGGLIAWGGTANHVAYIADVINANKIVIIQAGYNTPSWTKRNVDNTGWVCDMRTITRGSNNLWKYQNSMKKGSVCLGFVVNPAVDEELFNELSDTSFVMINGKRHLPYICINSTWIRHNAYILKNGKWKR